MNANDIALAAIIAQEDAIEAAYLANRAAAIEIGHMNAMAAIDQRAEYSSLDDAVLSYSINTSDTCVEQSLIDFVDVAQDAYEARIEELRAAL